MWSELSGRTEKREGEKESGNWKADENTIVSYFWDIIIRKMQKSVKSILKYIFNLNKNARNLNLYSNNFSWCAGATRVWIWCLGAWRDEPLFLVHGVLAPSKKYRRVPSSGFNCSFLKIKTHAQHNIRWSPLPLMILLIKFSDFYNALN